MLAEKRILNRWDSIAISIGIVIGVGIFRVPAEVANYLPNAGALMLLAWLAGGLISMAGALCYSELAAMFPDTGGDYAYLRRGYGVQVAFLFAWTELIIIRTGSIAAVSILFADYACEFLALDKDKTKILAWGIVLVLGALNIKGLNWGRKIQNVLSFSKVSAIILLIFCGFTAGHGELSRLSCLSYGVHTRSLITSFMLALIPILWTYGGWQENVFVAGETKDAGKALPFALRGAVFIVGSLYILSNAVFLYVIPPEKLARSTVIASDLMKLLYGGEFSSRVLSVLILIFASGSVNAMIITGSRITYAMAHDVPLFKALATRSPETGAPTRALLVNVIGGCVFILLGSFERLLFFTGFVVWLFFALAVVTIFIFRFRFPEISRPFLVPLYPLLPVCFILTCLALCASTFFTYPAQSLLGLILVFSGLPVFYLSRYLVSSRIIKEK